LASSLFLGWLQPFVTGGKSTVQIGKSFGSAPVVVGVFRIFDG
jgi:hypothetical protein